MLVTSADLVRQFGRWQDLAATRPVLVTHHGRGRIVLVSTTHYDELLAARQSSVDAPAPAETLDAVMEHVVQGFVAFDKDMTVRAVNRAACCFLKAERDAVIGRRLDERLPGIEETIGYASLARAASSGGISTFEMPSFAYEGRWLLVQTFPYGGGAACLFRDITDDLEARRQADAKSATLAALAVHGGVGRAKLSVRGTFAEVDATFAGLAGFAPEGLARTRLTDILATRWRRDAADAIEAVLEGGHPRSLDVDLLTKTGVERPVRVGLAAVRGQSGSTGALAVMTDTQLQRAAA